VNDTYSTTLTIFDSQGDEITLTLDFVKTGDNAWTWEPSVPLPATVTAPLVPTAITFSADGTLVPGADPTISIDTGTGATLPGIVWDLYDLAGVSNGDITQFASSSTTTFQTQNGYTSGTLRAVNVDEEGIIMGVYSNGELMPLFQMALADFPSYDGLSNMGNNLYAAARSSGQAMPGVPGNGRLGSISPSSIEMSNVDLAAEFVKMITTQRAFQANSKVITTSDEILADLISIKR